MKILEMLFKKLLKEIKRKPPVVIPRWIIFAFVVISFLGFLDATYLAAKYYLGTPLDCSIFQGCEKVTTSQYATIFDIPVALFGAIYYLIILILSLLYIDIKNTKIILILPFFTIIGFLASIWFVYLQIFVIKAICIYCMVSAVISTVLFIFGVLILKYIKIRIEA